MLGLLNPVSPQSAALRDGLGRRILHLRGLPPASRGRSSLCRVRLSVLATEGLRGTAVRQNTKPAPASASNANHGPRRGVPAVKGPVVGCSGRGDPPGSGTSPPHGLISATSTPEVFLRCRRNSVRFLRACCADAGPQANCYPKSEVEAASRTIPKLPASPIPLWLLGGAREQNKISVRVFDDEVSCSPWLRLERLEECNVLAL